MERRLNRLQTIWEADPRAVLEASWSIQWAIQYPTLDHDTAAWAARIRADHALDDAGLQRAIETALVRGGASRDAAQRLATLGLEQLMLMAAAQEEIA